VSKHAVRLLNHPEPANGDRCRRLLLPERSSLDAARRQTYARAQEQGWRLGSCFWRRAGHSPLWLLSPPFRTGRASLAGCRLLDRAESGSLAESAARATMQQRGAAGLGRRGRWASRSRARPVRWLHVRPARSYVCTPCAPRTAWRCCWSSLSQRSPRRVREVVTTRLKLESSNGRASTSASASRSGECHRWVARGAGRSRGRRRRCRCPRSGARARRPRARARRPSRGSPR
jgi:hypothetical protein